MIIHIQKLCGINTVDTSTIIYEDNAAYGAQMQMGYVKNNITKHIAPKFFYPHELQKNGEVKILQTRSCEIWLFYSLSLCLRPVSNDTFVVLE